MFYTGIGVAFWRFTAFVAIMEYFVRHRMTAIILSGLGRFIGIVVGYGILAKPYQDARSVCILYQYCYPFVCNESLNKFKSKLQKQFHIHVHVQMISNGINPKLILEPHRISMYTNIFHVILHFLVHSSTYIVLGQRNMYMYMYIVSDLSFCLNFRLRCSFSLAVKIICCSHLLAILPRFLSKLNNVRYVCHRLI